ncbi:MAG TPA: nucleotidyltransferase domain-containing protein [Rhodopila sp.]
MTRTIDLPPADSAIVRQMLRICLPPDVEAWVFGSRATDSARRYSDLDLALRGDGPLDLDMIGRLKDALSDSDLTIKVDLVDLHTIDPGFARRIAAEMVRLPFREDADAAGAR